jgi:DNA-binding NarL/FixJ family response regulator
MMMHQGKRLKAIVVDDKPEFVRGVKFFLEEELGCMVVGEASNGMELLYLKSLYYADIVLIDCEMPVMNGIETAKRVNYLHPNKKLIALTMYHDDICLSDMLGAGFSGYVFKPDIVLKLKSVMERVLNNERVFAKDLKVI